MSKNKRVTIQDIANETNVSYATVSKVLSGKVGGNIRVSEKTKNIIIEASKRLGYVPNHMARNLKSNNLSLISVFTYEEMGNIEIQKEFFDFYVGVYFQGEKLGLDVLFLNTRKNISSSSRVTLSSGAIMIGIQRDDSDIQALVKRNFPLVFVGRREITGLETNWVSFDYEMVIIEIFEALKQKNVKKILYIQTTNQSEPSVDKKNIVYSLAKENSIKTESIVVDKNTTLDSKQTNALLNNNFYLLDGLFQTSIIDKFLEENSLVLGSDKFGIVLEDNWLNVKKWTCWNNQRKELGALAAEHLYCILNKKEKPIQKFVPLKLIFNNSFKL